MVHRNFPVHPGYITNMVAEERKELEMASRVPTSILTAPDPSGYWCMSSKEVTMMSVKVTRSPDVLQWRWAILQTPPISTQEWPGVQMSSSEDKPSYKLRPSPHRECSQLLQSIIPRAPGELFLGRGHHGGSDARPLYFCYTFYHYFFFLLSKCLLLAGCLPARCLLCI